MNVQPYTINTEFEARAFLADLLRKREFRTREMIEERCNRLVKDPAVRAFFLAEGAKMLADSQDCSSNECHAPASHR